MIGIYQKIYCKKSDFSNWIFNLLYTVEFADGVKWLVRISSPGENGRFTPSTSRCPHSEVYTVTLLRRNMSIPIPEIFNNFESIFIFHCENKFSRASTFLYATKDEEELVIVQL